MTNKQPTQEQVIAWSREVELFATTSILMKFAALAYEAGRKDENEACAKACEHFISSKENNDAWTITRDLALQAAADVIRARREQ